MAVEMFSWPSLHERNVPDVGIELGAACKPREYASEQATTPGSSERSEQEKNQHFQTLENNKIAATIQKFWVKLLISLTFLVFNISLTNLQNSLTVKKNQISPDQWPPW